MPGLSEWTISRLSPAVSAGTSDLTSQWLDMQGGEGALFIVLLGDVAANCDFSVSLQMNKEPSEQGIVVSADTNIQFIATSTNADHQLLVLDIYKPEWRYLRLLVKRKVANAFIDGIIAVQYGPRESPTPLHPSIFQAIRAVSPSAEVM